MSKKETAGFNPRDLFERTSDTQTQEQEFNPRALFAETPSQTSSTYNPSKEQFGLHDLDKVREILKPVKASESEKEYIVNMAEKGASHDEISDAILTIQGKHPKQQEQGLNPQVVSDLYMMTNPLTAATAIPGVISDLTNQRYYLQDTGKGYKKPVALGENEKAPENAQTSSIFGTQEDAENDTRGTHTAKMLLWNVIPKTRESVNDLAQVVYGSITGDELPWYQSVKNANERLTFKTSSEYDKQAGIDISKVHSFSDFANGENWDFSPSSVANTFTNVLQSVEQFVLTRGVFGTAGKAAQAEMVAGKLTAKAAEKATKIENFLKGWTAATAVNLGEGMEAANELGVKGAPAYWTALAAAMGNGAIDVIGGGEGAINKAFKTQTGKSLIKNLVQGAIKDADGNMTKEVLDNLYKTAYAASEAVVKETPKSALRTIAEEAGQEVSQNVFSKFTQVVHDNLVDEGSTKYGAELFSAKSLAEYINDAIGGALGGAQGHFVAKLVKKNEKDDEKSKTIMGAVSSGNENELKTQLQAAFKSGDITKEDLDKGLFRIDAYKKYAEATADRQLDEESKRKIFDLTYEKSNVNAGIEHLEKTNVDGINDGEIKVKKDHIKEIEKAVEDIWKGQEEKAEKKPEPITKLAKDFKFKEPATPTIERNVYGKDEHLTDEEFQGLDTEDKFHYMFDKLHNAKGFLSTQEANGVLEIPNNRAATVSINGLTVELARSDQDAKEKKDGEEFYPNKVLQQYDKEKVTVKPVNAHGRKALALYDKEGHQILDGNGDAYYIRQNDKSAGRSKYSLEEQIHPEQIEEHRKGYEGVIPVGDFETRNLGREFEGKEESPEAKEIIKKSIRNPHESWKHGEKYIEFARRTIGAYKNWLKKAKNKSVIVSHSQSIALINQWEKQGRPENLNELDFNALADAKVGNEEISEHDSANGKIYLVRHGDTMENDTVAGTPNKFRSRQVGLAPQGEETAVKLGHALKLVGATDIVSSTLKRAMDTAKIIKNTIDGKPLGETKPKTPTKPKGDLGGGTETTKEVRKEGTEKEAKQDKGVSKEAKKADIEKRRKEELKNRVVYNVFPTVEDGEFKIIGDATNRTYRINESTGRPQVLDETNGLWSNTEFSPNLFMETTKRSGFEKSKAQINAKYDAELADLEKSEKADKEVAEEVESLRKERTKELEEAESNPNITPSDRAALVKNINEKFDEQVNKITNFDKNSKHGKEEATNGKTESATDKNVGEKNIGVVKKTETKRTGVPRHRQKIRNPLYLKILDTDVTEPYGMAIQYFVGKGLVATKSVENLYKNSKAEVSARKLSYLGKDAKSVEAIAEHIHDDLPEELQAKYDSHDLRNALEAVINEHTTVKAMAETFQAKYLSGEEMSAEEKAMMIIYGDEEVESAKDEEFIDNVIGEAEKLNDEDLNKITGSADEFGNWIEGTDIFTSDEPIDFQKIKDKSNLPKELQGKRIVSNTGFGGNREHTSGKVNLEDLTVLDNGIKTAKETFKTDKTFKPSKEPIVIGVDITTGEKQLLDGYHRYISKDGKGEVDAKFIPMDNGTIVSFDSIENSPQFQKVKDKIESPEFKEWFGKSKVVDENGKPLVVYHGSGTEINEFSHEFTGQGNDQLGSGFYFTTEESEAIGYQKATGGHANKLGGTDKPTVHVVYLSIQKPLTEKTPNKATRLQIQKFLTSAPEFEDHLWNYGDWQSEGKAKVTKEAVDAFVNSGYDNLIELINVVGNDFYRGKEKELLENAHKIFGYDGVETSFEGKKHFVAWFPNQIKSVDNKGTFSKEEANIYLQKPKSDEVKHIESELANAEAELKASKTAYEKKKTDLGKRLVEDQEDLFGERKSTEAMGMFADERASSSAATEALKPLKARWDKAQSEVTRLTKKLKEAQERGDTQISMFDQKRSQEFEKSQLASVQKITNLLQARNPKLKIVYDNTLKAAGAAQGNAIKINPFYAGTDTPIHEVAHILIDSIGGLANKIVAKAVEQIKSGKLKFKNADGTVITGAELWEETKKRYSKNGVPELSEEGMDKEVLAEAIGREGSMIFETEAAKSKFKTLLDYIFHRIKSLFGLERNNVRVLAKRVIGGDVYNSSKKTFDKAQNQIVGEKAILTKEITDNLILAKDLEGQDLRTKYSVVDDRFGYSQTFDSKKEAENYAKQDKISLNGKITSPKYVSIKPINAKKQIRISTGWERGADGNWRYETSDLFFKDPKKLIDKINNLNDKESLSLPLGELMKGAPLEVYPELNNITVKIINDEKDQKAGKRGSHERRGDNETISLTVWNRGEREGKPNWGTTKDANGLHRLLGVISHEAQHSIQEIEGFSTGGTSDMFSHTPITRENGIKYLSILNNALRVQIDESKKKDFKHQIRLLEELLSKKDWIKEDFDRYQSLAGEVEARNVQNRLDLTSEQRKNITLEETEDIKRASQLIFSHNGGISQFQKVKEEKPKSKYRQNTDKIAKEINDAKELEKFTSDQLLDIYNRFITDKEYKSKKELREAGKRIAYVLFRNRKEELNKTFGDKFIEAEADKSDLSWKDIRFKVLSHMSQNFPELQELSKFYDEATFAMQTERHAKKTKLEKLGKEVIKEKNKELGIAGKLANYFSNDNAKYFNYLDKDGKLLTLSEAKGNGLSNAQIEYLKYFRELVAERQELETNEDVYNKDLEILKTNKDFRETFNSEGIVSAINTYLGKGFGIHDVRISYGNPNTGKTEVASLGEIEKQFIEYGKKSQFKKASAILQMIKYNFKARKQYAKGVNADEHLNPLDAFKSGNYQINPKGDLTSKFDRSPEGDNYSKDFYRAALEFVDDSTHVKHMGRILPIVNAIDHLNREGYGEHIAKPNVVQYLDEWRKLHVFKEPLTTNPYLDTSLKFLRFYTSAVSFIFNVPAAIMNIAVGVYNNFRAENGKTVATGHARLFGDLGKHKNKSEYGYGLLNPYAIDLMRKYHVVSYDFNFNPKMFAGKLFDMLAYGATRFGEYDIQSSMVLGMMTPEEYNSFEYNDKGELVVKPGVDEKTLTKKILAYKERTSSIQGKYDEADKMNIMRGELGKTVFQFKLWIPSWWKERMGEKYITRDGVEHEGSYRAFILHGIKDLKADIKNKGLYKGINENKLFLTNIKGAMFVAFLMVLQNGDSDDDKKRRKALSLNNALGNLLFVFDVEQLKFTIKQPVAAMGTLYKFADALGAVMKEDAKSVEKKSTKLIPYKKIVTGTQELVGE